MRGWAKAPFAPCPPHFFSKLDDGLASHSPPCGLRFVLASPCTPERENVDGRKEAEIARSGKDRPAEEITREQSHL